MPQFATHCTTLQRVVPNAHITTQRARQTRCGLERWLRLLSPIGINVIMSTDARTSVPRSDRLPMRGRREVTT